MAQWEDDIEKMKDMIKIHMSDNCQLVDNLYSYYIQKEIDKKDFERCAEMASNIILNRLEQLNVSRTVANNK